MAYQMSTYFVVYERLVVSLKIYEILSSATFKDDHKLHKIKLVVYTFRKDELFRWLKQYIIVPLKDFQL
jgi:hypothetical protein